MKISANEFDQQLASDRLHIALVGMSNIGKSHWARHLNQKHGFFHYEVDESIQEKLSLSSISDSAHWMGQPYEEKYAKRADEYLALESQLTLAVTDHIGNQVIDTTGSVIHLPLQTQYALKENALTVYLKASNDDILRLVERFYSSPKPLIWGTHFEKQDGMSDEESLMYCFPRLLRARNGMYEDISDITLHANELHSDTDFLSAIRNCL